MGSHSVCFRCLKFLGSRHPTLVLPLVPELLSTHPFFDTAEPDMDDPACILCWLSRKFWPLFRQCSFGGLRVLDFVFSFSILLVKSICWGNLVIIIFLSFCFSIHSNSPLPLNSTNFLAIYSTYCLNTSYIFSLIFQTTLEGGIIPWFQMRKLRSTEVK